MTLPFSNEAYFDVVEEDARQRLQELSAAVAGEPLSDGVTAMSHDISYDETPWEILEHATTYRASAYDYIDPSLLDYPYPPEYVRIIVGALASVLVDHHNISHPGWGMLMKPAGEDLALHFDTIWTGLRKDDTQPAVDDEATIFQTPPNNYRLVMAHRAGTLSLDFVHSQRFAKLRLLTGQE